MVFAAITPPSFSYCSRLTTPNIPLFRKKLFSVLDFENKRMHFHDVIAMTLVIDYISLPLKLPIFIFLLGKAQTTSTQACKENSY